MFPEKYMAEHAHVPDEHEKLIDTCVRAFYVASESFDLRECRARDEDGLGRPTTGRELSACNNYAREQEKSFAKQAGITIHDFREACRRFSLSPAWKQLRLELANAPRNLR